MNEVFKDYLYALRKSYPGQEELVVAVAKEGADLMLRECVRMLRETAIDTCHDCYQNGFLCEACRNELADELQQKLGAKP